MDALKNCVACGSDNLVVTHYAKLGQPCSRALPRPFSKAECNDCGDSGYFSDGTDRKGQTYVVIDRTPQGFGPTD